MRMYSELRSTHKRYVYTANLHSQETGCMLVIWRGQGANVNVWMWMYEKYLGLIPEWHLEILKSIVTFCKYLNIGIYLLYCQYWFWMYSSLIAVNYMGLINQQAAILSSVFSSHLYHPFHFSFTPSPLPSQVLPGCISLTFFQPAKPGERISSLPAVFSAYTHGCPYACHKSCSSQHKVLNHTKQANCMLLKSLTFHLCMPISLSWSPGTVILMASLISLTTNWNDSWPRVVIMTIPQVKNTKTRQLKRHW